MDMRQAFPSKYLRAADVAATPHQRITLDIAQIKMEVLKNKDGEDTKPICYFRGAKKGLVLNKTNCERIAHHYGWDTDQWVGKPVELYVTEVEAFGETVDAIRVKIPVAGALPTQPATLPTIQRHTSPMQESAPAFDDAPPLGDADAPLDDDSSIPF